MTRKQPMKLIDGYIDARNAPRQTDRLGAVAKLRTHARAPFIPFCGRLITHRCMLACDHSRFHSLILRANVGDINIYQFQTTCEEPTTVKGIAAEAAATLLRSNMVTSHDDVDVHVDVDEMEPPLQTQAVGNLYFVRTTRLLNA